MVNYSTSVKKTTKTMDNEENVEYEYVNYPIEMSLETLQKRSDTLKDSDKENQEDQATLYNLKNTKAYENDVRESYSIDIEPTAFLKSSFCRNFHLLCMLRYQAVIIILISLHNFSQA